MVHPRISSQILRHVADFAGSRGVDVAPLLAANGLPAEALADFEGMVPLGAYLGFMEAASISAGMPHFGLAAAKASTTDSLGALSFLVLSAPTLLDGFSGFVRYLDAMQEGTHYALESEGHSAAFVYQIEDERLTPRRQDSEYSLGATHHLLVQYVGREFEPREVHFEHERAGRYAIYEEYFRCPVFFSQPMNRLLFDRALLDNRSAGLSNRLFPILAAHLQSLVSSRAQPKGFADQVTRSLDAQRLQSPPELAALAAEFGISASTFSRRLKAEGSSYRELLEARRMAMAERLIDAGNRSIADIALAVGFSETASFTRAFRRHFGCSPRDHARRAGTTTSPSR